MDSLKDVLSDLKIFIYGGFASLPITLAGTMLVIGLFTANYAMLFFLLGFLIATPLAAFMLNNLIGMKVGDVCRLSMPFVGINSEASEEYVVISEWLAMMCFFFGYLGRNAYQLMDRDSIDTSIDIKVGKEDLLGKASTRKTQSWVAMGSIAIIIFIVLAFRLNSGCEAPIVKNSPALFIPLLILSLGFTYAGSYGYELLSMVGQDRLSDLFGIANRLLPPAAIVNAPIACVPQP